MSRRIDLRKLAKMAKLSKVVSQKSFKSSAPAAKEVVIREKHHRDKVHDISPPTSKRTPVMAPGEGTSAYPSDVLGLNASMLKNPKKLFEGVIPPFDREEVGKLDLDRVISKLFYKHGRELRDGAMTQQARAKSVGIEMAIDELRKLREEQDATVEGLEKEVTELNKKEVLTKKSAIQEYKSSDDF
ncbi:hypothetical protein Acr_07g0010590 [Actinidia rufa]|uniref:Uncharacterized protein n=1 Tax=Actinidia rufa TaxID=165716 RepID=A0A7J0EWT7_9ERIC|nr:hypothetical protein Acr_07g0010590 [Actinidia rufa]